MTKTAGPRYDDVYAAWDRAGRTPEATRQAIRDLDAPLRALARRHTGRDDDAVVARARTLAVGALRTYRPAGAGGAGVATHLYHNLLGLKRFAAGQSGGVQTSERLLAQRRAVQNASQAFLDQQGREPSTAELADLTGLAPARLAKVRNYQVATPAAGHPVAAGPSAEASRLWQQIVYDDLAPLDQSILERSLGLHGQPVQTTSQIAKSLRRSPGAVSQRRRRIQGVLDQEKDLSPFMGAS